MLLRASSSDTFRWYFEKAICRVRLLIFTQGVVKLINRDDSLALLVHLNIRKGFQ